MAVRSGPGGPSCLTPVQSAKITTALGLDDAIYHKCSSSPTCSRGYAVPHCVQASCGLGLVGFCRTILPCIPMWTLISLATLALGPSATTWAMMVFISSGRSIDSFNQERTPRHMDRNLFHAPKEPVSPPSSKPATAMKDATHRGLGTRHATARNPWLFPKKCAEICSYDRMWLAVAVRLQCNYCMAPDVRMHSALGSIDAAPL